MRRILAENPAEQQGIADLEMCFSILDKIFEKQEPPKAKAGSYMSKDSDLMPEYRMEQWARPLMVVALDHLHLIRITGGQKPGGINEWHTNAPWTLLRATLESVSQVIWLLGPQEQSVRIQRLLRLVRDDLTEAQKATKLTVPLRKRKNMPSIKESDSEFWETADKWIPDDVTRRRINEEIHSVECVRDACRRSRVAKEDLAELLWRTASGHAHGRRWAPLMSSQFVSLGPVSESSSIYRATIDLNMASKLVMIATGVTQYADWLYAKRCGYDRQLKALVSVGPAPK